MSAPTTASEPGGKLKSRSTQRWPDFSPSGIETSTRLSSWRNAERRAVGTCLRSTPWAWASSRAGRLETARAAAETAIAVGTRDRRVLYHAAAIRHATGDEAGARRLVARALDGHARFDLVNSPAAVAFLDALTAAD